MKIALNLSLDIDPGTWRREFDLDDDADVREDIRAYFLNIVQLQLAHISNDDNRNTATLRNPR